MPVTGDGLLARPASQSVSPLETVLRALEAEVLDRTGVPVKLGGKTLRGDAALEWPAPYHAQTRPVSGHSGLVVWYPSDRLHHAAVGSSDKCSQGRRASPGARYRERLNMQRGNASGKVILRKHFTKPPQRTHQDNKIPDETAILNSPR